MNVKELAHKEVERLNSEMAAIFEPYKGTCEAPEYMPADALAPWNELYQMRRNIFQKLRQLEQAESELSSYLKMEVS